MKRVLAFISFILFLLISSRSFPIELEKSERKLTGITPENVEYKKNLLGVYIKNSDLDSAVVLCRNLLRYAQFQKDDFLKFTALANMGQIYLMQDRNDSSYAYLDRSLKLWDRKKVEFGLEERRPIYMMYNSLAIHAANADMDYEKATEYLIEGLKLARRFPEDPGYAIMAQNLVTIFFIRQNPAGLKYAQETYQDGKDRNDPFLMYVGTYGCAEMYCVQGNYEEAYKYVREAMSLIPHQRNHMVLYNLYGEIMAGLNQKDSAMIYFQKAIELAGEPTASVPDISYLSLSYGAFLRKEGYLEQSETVLLKGLDSALKYSTRIFTYRLYEELSKVYKDMNRDEESLEYYKKYLSESDSIFNIQRERAINELTLKYESERHENELSMHRMQFMRQKHRLQVLLILLLASAVAAAVGFVMYRNKNRMYTKIARQYRDAIASESNLIMQISVLENKLEATEKSAESPSEEAPASPVDPKLEDLFVRLESAMKNEHLYRDGDLTRDKVCEVIGTNRTYLTRVVSEQAGMSFNQYINAYRIREALTILSKPSNDIPLKALSAEIGFSSITTFYKVFKDEVGMTPAKYREKIVELAKEDE